VTLLAGIESEVEALGLELSEAERVRLEGLGKLWEHYGRAMNLLGKRSVEALQNNVLEALSAVSLSRQLQVRGPWLDVGSGGGFPGLVLAACCAWDIVLVEPREKRAAFLERALASLGRKDACVRRGRVAGGRKWAALDGLGELGEHFEVVDARAVMPLEEWLEVGRSWSDKLIFAHIGHLDGDPGSLELVGRVDTRVGSVRAYSVA
jgi:16S rRNA (guanine527-N7)-methyltransferase